MTADTFRPVFDSAEELDRIRHVVVPGNVQNLDKLAAELTAMA